MELSVVCCKSILGLLTCECFWYDSERKQSSECIVVFLLDVVVVKVMMKISNMRRDVQGKTRLKSGKVGEFKERIEVGSCEADFL